MKKWEKAQSWENEWHGNCVNSLNEELKQLVYAEKIGLDLSGNNKTPYAIDMQGKTVLDIGSGPYSLLLKCENVKGYVLDPLMDKFPSWVVARYAAAGISFSSKSGEEVRDSGFDEVWIYNVLQHVKKPQKIIKNALRAGALLRLFEWVDTGVNIGHIHNLTEEKLNKWTGGEGKVEYVNKNGAKGLAYYGVFV